MQRIQGELCEKAGVDPSKINIERICLMRPQSSKRRALLRWPLADSEKWPLQFYPALLMMRILGKEGMASPCKGENGGFAGPEVVKAWKMYKELCNLDPFQEGFQTAKAREAASLFHNGMAAFHLQAGAWVRPNSQITVQNTVHDNSEHVITQEEILELQARRRAALRRLGRRKQERCPRPDIRAGEARDFHVSFTKAEVEAGKGEL